MLLQQFFIAGLGHASYLVGDEAAGEAAVIDPRRDVDVYLRAAAGQGLTIRHVLETHTPNDYISGARDLAALTGATCWASGAGGGAGLRFGHQALREGDEVRVGALTLRAWETPGHTPEHLAYLALDGPAGGPVAVFSGGSLLAGGAGRTDLAGAGRGGGGGSDGQAGVGRSRELARAQQESVRRLLALPAQVRVYPTHGGGSLCAGGSDSPWSTVGRERETSEIARLALEGDAEAFAGRLLGNLPPLPAHWRRMHARNRRGPTPLAGLGAAPGLESLLPPRGISPEDVRSLVERGQVYVVDARGPEAFGGAHLPGSFGAGLGHTFGLWVGSVVPDDRPLILVLPGADDPLPGPLLAVWGEAVRQLLRAGYDHLAGYLAGGVRAWAASGLPVGAVPQISPREAWDGLRRGERGLLDVRQPAEWRRGHAPDATFVPGATLPARVDALRDRPWAVICATGYRSTVAASVLLRAGAPGVANVLGGMAAWKAAGLPETSEVEAQGAPRRHASRPAA